MTTYLLVPGMWLGGWAWDRVATRLRYAGHDVYALTLTGVGERAAESAPEVDLDTHVADIVDVITDEDLNGVVLVGHSYAAAPVRMVADQVPDRIVRTVYVDSGPFPNGVSQSDMNQPVEDGDVVPPPEWTAAADPENYAGLDEASFTLLTKRSTAHPLGTVTQPVRLHTAHQPPTDIICCTFPLEAARQMIEQNHPYFSGLDRENYRLHALPTGHWPMLSRPGDLADLLATLH